MQNDRDELQAALRLRGVDEWIATVVHDDLRDEPDAVCAYLSGSLIEGYGNTQSDIDMFLLYDTTDPASLRPMVVNDGVGIDISWNGSVRVDAEKWTLRQVQDAIVKVNSVTFEPGVNMYFPGIRDIELQFLHRLIVGLPVKNATLVTEFQQSVDQRRLSLVLAARAATLWQAVQEDAVGAVESRQWGTALLQSRVALGLAMDALIAARGSTNNKAKWRFVKMEQWCSEDERAAYLKAELEDGPAPDEILASSKRRIRQSNALSQEAQHIIGRRMRDLTESVAT